MVCVCAPSLKVSISAMKAIVAVTNSVLWKNTSSACGSPQAFITTMGRRSSSLISPKPSYVIVWKSCSRPRGNCSVFVEKSWMNFLPLSSTRSASHAAPYRVGMVTSYKPRQRTSMLPTLPRPKLRPTTVLSTMHSAKRNAKLPRHSD